MKRRPYKIDRIDDLWSEIKEVESEFGPVDILHFVEDKSNPTILKIDKVEMYKKTEAMHKELMRRALICGKFGWATWNTKEITQRLHQELIVSIDDEKHRKIVDHRISSLLSKDMVNRLHISIRQKDIDEDNKIKVDQAFAFIKNRQYYEATIILCGVVDSINIKKLDQLGNENVTQGWTAFAKIIKASFSEQFNFANSEVQNGSQQRAAFEEKLIGYEMTNNRDMDMFVYEIANLCAAHMTLFDNCNWTDYREEFPSSINRNWLMHGMYPYKEIKKMDAIKVAVVLYSLIKVYEKINNNTNDCDERQ